MGGDSHVAHGPGANIGRRANGSAVPEPESSGPDGSRGQAPPRRAYWQVPGPTAEVAPGGVCARRYAIRCPRYPAPTNGGWKMRSVKVGGSLQRPFPASIARASATAEIHCTSHIDACRPRQLHLSGAPGPTWVGRCRVGGQEAHTIGPSPDTETPWPPHCPCFLFTRIDCAGGALEEAS